MKQVAGNSAIRVLAKPVSMVFVCAIVIAVIIFAPIGMTFVIGTGRDWTLLGNVGQAYGGISALVSALALAGIVGALLIQRSQHKIERITAVRGFQSGIYSIIREDPWLYFPVMGGDLQDETSIKRRLFGIELLQYIAAGFETGLITDKNLRNEALPGFFRYEENRQYWEMAREFWLTGTSDPIRRAFIRIVDEELARAKSEGTGHYMPLSPGGSQKPMPNQKMTWLISAFAGGGATVVIAFLISRHRRR